MFKRSDIKKYDLRIQSATWIPDYNLRDTKTADVIPTLKKVRKSLSKRSKDRRIIQTIVCLGYEFSYHATKGWRKTEVYA